jgi:C_GCAxxG_C_C family probable redox protein
MMADTPEAAVAMFLEGYNCAQAVLACCGEPYGLPRATAIQVAQAFGGGMGKTGNTCGAVTGALMAIGLKHGAKDGADADAKARTYRLAQEFLARFRAAHESVVCRELLGCDISTPEGHAEAVERRLFRTVCPELVRNAARIMEELLAEPR